MDKVDIVDRVDTTVTAEHAPRISLVVPAYNEEKLLPHLLESVRGARERFRGGPDAVEVIVADNASTDGTAEIARAAGCRVARVEKRRIAAARNGGAAIARGEVLAFVDADLVIHPETFNAIDEALRSGECVAGATGWKFERNSLGLAMTRILVRGLVTWTLGIEGGVVFCRRDAYDAVGGYNEGMEVAEDIAFLRALRAYGKPRGLRVVLGTPPAIATVSTRKFDEHGDWHMFTMTLWPLLKRKSFRRIVDEYWYPDKR